MTNFARYSTGSEMIGHVASERATFGAPSDFRDREPGEVVVRFHPQAIRPHLPGGHLAGLSPAIAREMPDTVFAPLDYLRANAGLEDVEPLFPDEGLPGARGRLTRATRDRLAVAASVTGPEDDELAGLAVARLAKGKATSALLKRIHSASSIDFIEPAASRWLLAARTDPKRNLQWALRAINWFDTKLPDASQVAVGVLDTGIDAAHPDLRATPIDYDHSGAGKRDLVGHGTHVAGIIAAGVNNGIGITGVAACRLAIWKIFGDKPVGEDFYVDKLMYYRALRAASRAGLSAVNLSIGGTLHDSTEALLMRRLVDSGVTVCAAMGNEFDAGNPVEYPAAFDDVVSVGSIAEDRQRSAFSNTGRHIDLVAPGSNILSTLPTRRSKWRDETNYAAWSGTSMATPHVAAAAGLISARRPDWAPSEITKHLHATAAPVAAMKGRKPTNEYGAGLLDLKAALR